MDKNKLALNLIAVAVDTVVFAGVGIVVGSTMNAVVPEQDSKIKKALVRIGTVAITAAVGSVVNTELEKNFNAFQRGIQNGRKLAEGETDGD